jgi:hypothetical protein
MFTKWLMLMQLLPLLGGSWVASTAVLIDKEEIADTSSLVRSSKEGGGIFATTPEQ